jgi:predicted dehydrogenase
MVNVAIVGSGKMGILHAAILGGLPGSRVVAICEKQPVVRHYAKNAFPKIKVFGDVSELTAVSVDAVYVATLPASHHPIVEQVYSLGIADHVFVEKSMAASHDQALEMCRMSDERGGVSMVGFQKRFSGTCGKTKELLDSGAIGEVRSFDAYAYSSDFAQSKSDDDQAVSRGGVLRDQGSHSVDMAHWFFGELETLPAPTAGNGAGAEPSDLTTGRVRTADGAEGSFSVSAQMPEYRLPEIGMRISGSDGDLKVNEDMVELSNGDEPQRWHRHDFGDSEVPFLLGDPEYSRESQAFIGAIESGTAHNGADFEAGARVERVIDAILEGQS